MGSVTCDFSLSPAPSSDLPFPHSEPLLPRPRVSPDLNSRFPPSTATGSEARSTEFTTAGCPVRRFKIGDMVWGAVKSHPWWPGQIFDEACALPIVRRSKVDGHVLVAFFGDSSYGWLDPSDVLPFEPHFPDLSKQEGSPSFVNAVVDAVDEVNRRAALGFVCRCRIPFHPTRVPGYVTVDVPGYEPGDYSKVQIEEARESIQPSEVFSIANELAVTPRRKEVVSVDRIRRKAMLLAYRRAVFEEVDQAYDEAFGRKTVQPKILNIRDGGSASSPKKKKGLLQKRGDALPTSDEDTNLRLSDLLATSRRRHQPEGLSTTRPAAIAARPVVGQISGFPASLSASPSDVSTPELQAELHPCIESKPEPPSEPEPMIALKPELELRSVLTTSPLVTVSNRAADEVGARIHVPKRPLENPKPKMKKTVKRPKRETPPPEPKPLDESSDHSEERHLSSSSNTNTAFPPRVSEFQLSQALGDLRSLAIDVFFEDERNTPKIVKRVFGRFRSMVYRKRKPDQLPVSDVSPLIVTSIVVPAGADQLPVSDVHPPSIAESKLSLLPSEDLAMTVDRAIPSRKRADSDELEEMSAKRIKRSEKLKVLSKKIPKSAVKTHGSGGKKDVGSAVVSPESIQQLDSRRKKDADSAVVSLSPNQQLHSEIKEVMDSAVAELKLHPELDSASKKDVDSTFASAKPIQQLDLIKIDVDSTVAELKADQQLSADAKKDLGPAVAELKTNKQLSLEAKKYLGPAVAELKTNKQLSSGAKKDLGPAVADFSLGVKKDVTPAVAKRKLNQQLGSETKKGGSAVAKRKPNQQLNLGTKKDVGSVAELKLNQQLDSGTEEDGSAVATLLDLGTEKDGSAVATLLDSGTEKDSSAVATLLDLGTEKDGSAVATLLDLGTEKDGSAVATLLDSGTEKDSSAVATLLDSGKKKDVSQAVASLKPNQQLDTVTKNDVGSSVSVPQLNSSSTKDVDSAVAEPKLNLHLNSVMKKEVSSAVAALKPNQQLNSGTKTELGSAVAEVKPNPQPNSASKKPANPTYLIMKFPSDAVLPKVPYLNMRFSRLGKINESSTGVNLKTNSCRVLFKSRSDAELAFKYVDCRQFFGEVKVEYILRDVGPRPKKAGQEAVKVEYAAGQEVVLPAGSTAPLRDAALPARQPEELPKKVVDKAWTTKSGVAKEPLPARQPTELSPVRQPAELLPKPCVEKDISNVAGTTESAALRNVALAVRPAELPPKPCIKKAVDKSLTTKEVRFSVGGGDSMMEPTVGRPSEPNAGRNVHVPKPTTRPSPPLPLPLPPAQLYRGILGPSPLAPSLTMDGGSGNRADISRKMMSLLVKCNEVVDSVKSSLGYLPYHPI